MPERIDAAIVLRREARGLRKIAGNRKPLCLELVRTADTLEDQARKLEAAAIRDLDKTACY